MPVRIVDASAMGALIFGEPKAEEIAKALEDSPMVSSGLNWRAFACGKSKTIQLRGIRF